MAEQKSRWWVAPLVSIGCLIAAPYVKSKFEGTPLNGFPGIIAFWKALFAHSVPLWFLAVVFIFVVGVGAFLVRRKLRKLASIPDLRIVVLSTPEPAWNIGAMGSVPYLALRFNARLAHQSEGSIEIVSAHLEGTECKAPFFPIVVSGPYDPAQMIHFGVRPVIAKDGKPLTRRVILVDQFGNEHWTKPVSFQPSRQPAEKLNPGATPLNCVFCGQGIGMEELSEVSAVPAHKRCIR